MWNCFCHRCAFGNCCSCIRESCFSCSLRPACANGSRPPASVQPLSVIVWGLGHSWSIPLCFHGSVWSLSAEAQRSLLTGVWTDRVNVEFTRLAPWLAVPLACSLLCLLSVSFLANPSSSPPCVPSLPFVSLQRWYCRRFLWERRDLWWSESNDVFSPPC